MVQSRERVNLEISEMESQYTHTSRDEYWTILEAKLTKRKEIKMILESIFLIIPVQMCVKKEAFHKETAPSCDAQQRTHYI